MAASTTKRSTSARPKSSSAGKSKSSGNGSSATKRSGSGSSRSTTASSRKSTPTKNGRSTNAGASSNGSSRSVVSKAKTPLLAGGAAAAGLVGGFVLASRGAAPSKKVLGVPVSGKGFDFKPVAKEVQKAGKQLGRFADEIAQAREQARKIGDALS
jgi:hypothetical protein